MAIRPDYTTGTITLTSGSVNFTTTGAALQTAQIAVGDQILLPAKGLVLTIATITGQNAGTLTDNCPAGAAGVGQVYRIRYQSDNSRYTSAVENMLIALSGGNIDALAGLTSDANKVPFFTGGGTMSLADFKAWARSMLGLTMAADKIAYGTGANTMDLTTLTSFARTLLDDANAAAVLATLGLDYGNGSWTPKLEGATTPGSYTYSTQRGSYLKLGPWGFLDFDIGVSAVGAAGSGTLIITGQPFNNVNGQLIGGGSIGGASALTSPANFAGWGLRTHSVSTLGIVYTSSTTGTISVPAIQSTIGVGSVIRGSILIETS